MTEQERQARTFHEKIFIARPSGVDEQQFGATITELVDAAMRGDGAEIRRLLGVAEPVPWSHPQPTKARRHANRPAPPRRC
jgi:hypothetical protein